MIVYRPFRNTDPPSLTELWNFSRLGPGAAHEISNDVFDMLVLAEPYFDRHGLIVACDGAEVVGFVHAGFGANPEGSGLSHDTGIVSAVIVRFDYRRRGIGRELVARAESYLRDRGATRIVAGESDRRNPFYLGLYGSADCAGFLESDPCAAPFFTALGYRPLERHIVLQRDISAKKDPFDPRALALKRTVKLGVLEKPPSADWWWMTRHGRFESLTFALVPNKGGLPPVTATCWGMELHAQARQQRTVGITDLVTTGSERRKGLARVLLGEVIRQLREDRVTQVEAVVPSDNEAALALFRSLAFEQTDAGVVYER